MEKEMADKKHMELLLRLEAAHLVLVPTGISNRTMNLLKKNGLMDKEKLRAALTGYGLARLPGAGEQTRREACWWLIYGDEACRSCGK